MRYIIYRFHCGEVYTGPKASRHSFAAAAVYTRDYLIVYLACCGVYGDAKNPALEFVSDYCGYHGFTDETAISGSMFNAASILVLSTNPWQSSLFLVNIRYHLRLPLPLLGRIKMMTTGYVVNLRISAGGTYHPWFTGKDILIVSASRLKDEGHVDKKEWRGRLNVKRLRMASVCA